MASEIDLSAPGKVNALGLKDIGNSRLEDPEEAANTTAGGAERSTRSAESFSLRRQPKERVDKESTKRTTWTQKEDDALLEAVKTHGTVNWTLSMLQVHSPLV